MNAAAATVVAIVAFAKVLSPQYLLWMVALVAAASVAQKAVIPLLLCILGLTQVWVPGRFRQLQDLDWVTWVLLARNLLLVGLFVVLAMHLHARRVAGEPASRTNIPTTSRSRSTDEPYSSIEIERRDDPEEPELGQHERDGEHDVLDEAAGEGHQWDEPDQVLR